MIWLYVLSLLEIFFIDFNLKVEEGDLNFLGSLTSELEDSCSSKSLEARRRKSTICSGTLLHHKFDLRLTRRLNTKREASAISVPDLEQGVALSDAAVRNPQGVCSLAPGCESRALADQVQSPAVGPTD